MENKEEQEKRISELLCKLQECFPNNGKQRTNIEFPRGILRTANDFRNELNFIENKVFKTNLAYHLMLTDFYSWFLNRFNIKLTAKEMIIKEGICLYGNICGSIAEYFGKKILDRKDRVGVKKSLTELVNLKIIDNDLKKEIRYLWGQRNKEHLLSLKVTEYNVYSIDKYNKAVLTWQNFRNALKKAKNEGKI
ncbi:MAG: hypothetical protein FJ150_00055 [Euryarchaeota archaeon]|nr:hypothetical protein [Euryarchaeota archaeon]